MFETTNQYLTSHLFGSSSTNIMLEKCDIAALGRLFGHTGGKYTIPSGALLPRSSPNRV